MKKWLQPYLVPSFLQTANFREKISMKSFFSKLIPKAKNWSVFKSSKTSLGRRLKDLSKWMCLLFPRLIQAAILKIFQGFLNKWIYTLQYHHFLAADCCSGLHQLQSFYHMFLTLWLGLLPTGWLVVFSLLFFSIQALTSSNDSRSPGFTCKHIRCTSYIWFQYICCGKHYRFDIAGKLPTSR